MEDLEDLDLKFKLERIVNVNIAKIKDLESKILVLDEIIIKGPKRVYIFGKHRKDLLKTMKHENIKDFATLDEALKDLKSSNDSSKILFSPGNPSGKDFQNFSERGQYFKNKVLKYFGE